MNATVRDVMTSQVIAVRRGATFKEMAAALRRFRVSALPVVDDEDKVLGVVSEADLLAKEALADPPGLISVTVQAGVVTLQGCPETTALGHEIVRKARHVRGVVAVRDRLSYPDDSPVVAAPLF